MRTLLTYLLFFFVLVALGEGLYIWLHKCKCPEIEPVEAVYLAREPLSKDSIVPETVIAIPDSKFDTLFSEVKMERPKKKLFQKENWHRVKRGENLYRIGLKYGVPYEFLMQINNMKTPDIKVGQQIYLGTVEQRKAYLSKLVKEKGISADSLYIYNKYYGDSLFGAEVYTESFGPINNQVVTLKYTPFERPKNHIYLGVKTDFQNSVSLQGAFINKKGWGLTGATNLYNAPTLEVGFLKKIK